MGKGRGSFYNLKKKTLSFNSKFGCISQVLILIRACGHLRSGHSFSKCVRRSVWKVHLEGECWLEVI